MTASSNELRGLFVPIVTPFGDNGGVDSDGLMSLCHDLLRQGATGIVALGTTGEASALNLNERRAVVATCAQACSESGAQLIVGAGTNSTAASLDMLETLCAVSKPAAVLTVVPYYVRPSEAGVVEHFRHLAEASPAPLIVYNVPYRTGLTLSAECILELARLPNVFGMKQAVGAIDLTTLRVLAEAPSDFAVLAGDDAFIAPTVLLGGSGAIAASAHVCTDLFARMVESALKADSESARFTARALLPVVQAIFAEPNPTVVKGVLHAQGRIPTENVRLPLLPASTGAVREALDAIARTTALLD